MTVSLSEEKLQKIETACMGLTHKKRKAYTIRELVQVIGQSIASFSAVTWGQLFHRQRELKSDALNKNCGNVDALTRLSEEAERELDWWIENVRLSKCSLEESEPQLR